QNLRGHIGLGHWLHSSAYVSARDNSACIAAKPIAVIAGTTSQIQGPAIRSTKTARTTVSATHIPVKLVRRERRTRSRPISWSPITNAITNITAMVALPQTSPPVDVPRNQL